jgi:hypothetical protein
VTAATAGVAYSYAVVATDADSDLAVVKVPIVVTGESVGVKSHGAILEHLLREIEIQCLPSAIPDQVTVVVQKVLDHRSVRIENLYLLSSSSCRDTPHLLIKCHISAHASLVRSNGAELEAPKDSDS